MKPESTQLEVTKRLAGCIFLSSCQVELQANLGFRVAVVITGIHSSTPSPCSTAHQPPGSLTRIRRARVNILPSDQQSQWEIKSCTTPVVVVLGPHLQLLRHSLRVPLNQKKARKSTDAAGRARHCQPIPAASPPELFANPDCGHHDSDHSQARVQMHASKSGARGLRTGTSQPLFTRLKSRFADQCSLTRSSTVMLHQHLHA